MINAPWLRILIFISFFIGISSCKTTSHSQLQGESSHERMFSFNFLNDPSPEGPQDLKEIGGAKYPRIFQSTYRASSHHQLPLGKMLRAMFNDPYAPIESKHFTALKFTALGWSIPFSINDSTQAEITRLKAPLSDLSGKSEARIIHDLYPLAFQSIEKDSAETLRNRYIYYKAEEYQDFADTLIYTSTLPNIASFYGPRLVELNAWDSPINGGSPRSADMNYLNYQKYGKWLEDGLPANLSFYWEDSGQFITPIVTAGSAVTGYQIRDRFQEVDREVNNPWNIFEIINKKLIGEFRSVQQSYSPIDFAFYKMIYKGETIIGVFSGLKEDNSDSTCMIRNLKWGGPWAENISTQIPYHCTEQKPWKISEASNEAAALIGIVRFCDRSCNWPDNLLKAFPNSKRQSLSRKFIEEIESSQLYQAGPIPVQGKFKYLPIQ